MTVGRLAPAFGSATICAVAVVDKPMQAPRAIHTARRIAPIVEIAKRCTAAPGSVPRCALPRAALCRPVPVLLAVSATAIGMARVWLKTMR